MGKKREAIRNLVIISDTHCGCQFGLCPPGGIDLDGGGHYNPSKSQLWVWAKWELWWGECVPRFTKGAPYALVLNGDVLEGRHHDATTQLSHNLSDHAAVALACIMPLVDGCEGRLYYVRGTEAHGGRAGEQEEALAKGLGCVGDGAGRHSRDELWIRVGGRLVHCLHHIGTTSSAHYRGTALYKELNESYIESAKWAQEAPAAVVRSHRHLHDEIRISTAEGYGYSIVTPGWQLKTPLAYRVAGGRVTTPEVGGTVLIAGDEDFYPRHRTWKLPRPKVEVPRV